MRRRLPGILPLAALLFFSALLPAQERGADGEEMRAEDVAARVEARRSRRLDADGSLPADALLRAWEQLEEKKTIQKNRPRTPSDAAIWNWEWLGPGNIGGRLRAIVINPVDPDIMVVGTAGGGIWRTTSGGSWWWPASDFLPSLPVVSLAMDPTNPQIIYAGTGELIGSNGDIPGAGIFKSTSGGLTWSRLQSTAGSDYNYAARLSHHPTTSGTLLAATATGVWRTTDGGGSWDHIFTSAVAACDVDYDPANPDRIWVGTYNNVWLTTNGGANWSLKTSGGAGNLPTNLGRCEITFAPARPHILYVSPGKDVPTVNDMSDIIWRSLDSGKTWNQWKATNADRWSNAIWVSPTDPDLVVWGGFGDLFRTTDGGATTPTQISDWREYDKGNSAHSDQHAIVAHPGYNGTTNRIVYFGNDGGIQRADDVKSVAKTTGWTNLANNLGVSQFFGGAISPLGDLAIGGTQDNGQLRYTSAGGQQGWTLPKTTGVPSYSLAGDGQYCAVNYDNPAFVFITFPNLEIWRSDDGGLTFSQKISGLGDALSASDWLAPFSMDPNVPTTLVAGGVRIWRTTDNGDNWSQIGGAVSGSPAATAIDIAQSNSAVIWVGYKNGAIAHTTNAGGGWATHTHPWGNVAVTDIAINPWVQDEVMVTVGGYSTTTVWLTTNAGNTWSNRNGTAPDDLPAVQVNTVRYHPLRTNWIYVGTDLGVFASEDKGLHWSVTPRYDSPNTGNEGPNNVEVEELFWQGTSHLIAATHGRGMYRCAPLPLVFVDYSYVGIEDGTEFRPYNTVQEAIDNYGPGAIVSIRAGTYDGPALFINKRGKLTSTGGTAVIK